MKKFYFLAAAMLLGAGAYAQTDLTPDRFKFANQPEGEFTINYFFKSANPTNGFPEALAGADDGFVASGNGQFTNTAEYPDIALGTYLKKYVTIEDLGGEVGKVLCIKGSESTAEYGAEPDAALYAQCAATPSSAVLCISCVLIWISRCLFCGPRTVVWSDW